MGKKNVLITGGSGFIGRALCKRLTEEGHSVAVLSRSPGRIHQLFGPSVKGIASLDDIDGETSPHIIINLAGAPVADRRWSPARKELLMKSRIDTTRNIVDYIEKAAKKPERLISGSAVGYYGDGGDKIIVEESPVHDEFTHHLCSKWEEEALKAKESGVSVAICAQGL